MNKMNINLLLLFWCFREQGLRVAFSRGDGAAQEHMSTAGVPCLYAEIGKSGTGGAAYKRHGGAYGRNADETPRSTSKHHKNHKTKISRDARWSNVAGWNVPAI